MKDHHINRLSKLILILSLLFTASCNYYKPILTSPSLSSSAKSKEIASMSQRAFIIRSNQGDFLLKNVNVKLDEEELIGMLGPIPEEHQTYIKDKSSNFSYDSETKPVLQELHLYVPLDPDVKFGSIVTIPISSIEKMEVIERDKKRSTTNSIIYGVGLLILPLVLFFIIFSSQLTQAIA